MDFERLMSLHKDAVYRQMIRVCGDRDDAEDVLVEALLRAHKAAASLRDDGSFENWVSTVGRRICFRLRKRDELRPLVKLEREELERLDSGQLSPDDLLQGQELTTCIRDAVAMLPADQRNVFILRDIEGLSGEETAASLGISLAATKSRLHRARRELRAVLDKELLRS